MKHTRIHYALERINLAFASRKRPDAISYCTNCTQPDEIFPFMHTALDQMTIGQFRPLLSNASYCFGVWDEIAYYIPRVLELCVSE